MISKHVDKRDTKINIICTYIYYYSSDEKDLWKVTGIAFLFSILATNSKLQNLSHHQLWYIYYIRSRFQRLLNDSLNSGSLRRGPQDFLKASFIPIFFIPGFRVSMIQRFFMAIL